MCRSSFYDLICKVQGPIEVDMFSENLEVVGLGGRIRHILKLPDKMGCDRRSGRNVFCVVAADHAVKLWARMSHHHLYFLGHGTRKHR